MAQPKKCTPGEAIGAGALIATLLCPPLALVTIPAAVMLANNKNQFNKYHAGNGMYESNVGSTQQTPSPVYSSYQAAPYYHPPATREAPPTVTQATRVLAALGLVTAFVFAMWLIMKIPVQVYLCLILIGTVFVYFKK